MSDIITYWLNYMSLNDIELKNVREPRKLNPIIGNIDEYNQYAASIINKMPNSNISLKTYHLVVAESATTLIDSIFQKEVDDETLVITTSFEHTAVNNNLQKCKNVVKLNYYDDILNMNLKKIEQVIAKYKKVFVYMIGTQISTGEVTSQAFFEKIKNLLNKNDVQSVFAIDDVHGMYIVPRDYSFFDYIIGTAHALIRPYDMGILISKSDDIGMKANNWIKDYSQKLDIILSRKDKMQMFTMIMNNIFADFLSINNFERITDNISNIYAIRCNNMKFTQKMKDDLNKFEIRIEDGNNKNTIIRFRAQQFITFPEFMIEGIKLVRQYMNDIKEVLYE